MFRLHCLIMMLASRRNVLYYTINLQAENEDHGLRLAFDICTRIEDPFFLVTRFITGFTRKGVRIISEYYMYIGLNVRKRTIGHVIRIFTGPILDSQRCKVLCRPLWLSWMRVRLETRRSLVRFPPRSATFFRGNLSWNIFYGHSLSSADSRRAVVSFWRKNVHNTG